jgi:predicted Zn-dependent peptidase
MDYSYTTETLENGLRLLWMHLPHVHSASLHAYVATGPAYEKPQNNGVSHMLEHLHMAITRRHPTRAELTQAFVRLPLHRDAETETDLLCFTFELAPPILGEAAELLGDILELHPYPPEVIETERRLLLSELASMAAYEARWPRLLFGKHPFGLPQGGTPRTIGRLSAEQIEQFDQASFSPERIVVTAVGNLPPRELDRARARFAKLVKQTGTQLEDPESPKLKLPTYRRWSKLTPYKHVLLGFMWNDPLSERLRVARSVIAFWLSSTEAQLHERLRYTHGSTYLFDSDIHQVRDTSVFYFWAAVSPRERDALVKTALQELADLRRQSLVADWLPIVQAKYGFALEYCLDLPSVIAQRIGREEAARRKKPPITIQDELRLLAELQPADVVNFAAEYLIPQRFLAFFDARSRLFDGARFRKLIWQHLA